MKLDACVCRGPACTVAVFFSLFFFINVIVVSFLLFSVYASIFFFVLLASSSPSPSPSSSPSPSAVALILILSRFLLPCFALRRLCRSSQSCEPVQYSPGPASPHSTPTASQIWPRPPWQHGSLQNGRRTKKDQEGLKDQWSEFLGPTTLQPFPFLQQRQPGARRAGGGAAAAAS